MANFQIKEIHIQHPIEDMGDVTVTLVISVYGKRRRYSARGYEPEEVIRDAYFCFTGNMAYAPGTLNGNRDWIFSETKADPENFDHLERVPEFLELPF